MIKDNFSIENQTRNDPGLSGSILWQMKEKILGKKYNLELIFAESKTLKKLNKTYRGIDKATDILSFPISKKEGQIFICPSESKKMSKDFNREEKNFLYFLFIHGLVHLKGFDHGSKMENEEKKFRKKFSI